MSTYKLTLIAILAALAVTGRYAFQFIPNVQPVTTIIIISAFFLGPGAGVILAVLTAYLSNLVMGMGLWTVWQISAWAVLGIASGLMGKYLRGRKMPWLVFFSFFAGYFYGFVLSMANYMVAGNFLSYYLVGLPFDTYHAIGNVFFMLILYPVLERVFHRYTSKNLSFKAD